MGIFAYYTGSNDLTISEKPNFMYNQEVKRKQCLLAVDLQPGEVLAQQSGR